MRLAAILRYRAGFSAALDNAHDLAFYFAPQFWCCPTN
ncbi:hypothetical protein BOTU111922_05290 [Bordetella tumulicola]